MKFSGIFHLSVLLALLLFSCKSPLPSSDKQNFPDLSGSYLGQTQPDSFPGLFAPDVVSTGMYTRDMAMTPDGKELYFCVAIGGYTYSTILFSKEVNGKWTPPEIVPFSGGPGVADFEPAISPDGSKLFFLSNRPDGDEPVGDQDIWVVERSGGTWSEPRNLSSYPNRSIAAVTDTMHLLHLMRVILLSRQLVCLMPSTGWTIISSSGTRRTTGRSRSIWGPW